MKDFDFSNVGKRLPYSVPEEFFSQAKAQAKANVTCTKRAIGYGPIIYKVAIAASMLLAICGATMWFEQYKSPKKQYERLLSEVPSETLWEYVCVYDTDIENIDLD